MHAASTRVLYLKKNKETGMAAVDREEGEVGEMTEYRALYAIFRMLPFI